MFALFHLVFEVVKIAVQSAVYLTIMKGLLSIYNKIAGSNRRMQLKFKTIYFVIAGSLFIFSCTYYGNHGLGDEANIPLGYKTTMHSGDGYAYLNLERDGQINVDSFLVRDDHLYFTSNNNYYDYQLASGKIVKYLSSQDYEAYASAHTLPQINEMKAFYPQYEAYWNGWRFWFLP